MVVRTVVKPLSVSLVVPIGYLLFAAPRRFIRAFAVVCYHSVFKAVIPPLASVVTCRWCVFNRASAGRPVRQVHVHVLMYDLLINMRFRTRRYGGSVQNLS